MYVCVHVYVSVYTHVFSSAQRVGLWGYSHFYLPFHSKRKEIVNMRYDRWGSSPHGSLPLLVPVASPRVTLKRSLWCGDLLRSAL